jgi:hypothetical protein
VSRYRWVVAIAVAAVLIGFLIWGIHVGDVQSVLSNARAYCYT